MEVEELHVGSDVESEWSGIGGWKASGLQDIAFGLMGLKEIGKERNELLREQNGILKRNEHCLEGGLGAGNEEDSTVRE